MSIYTNRNNKSCRIDVLFLALLVFIQSMEPVFALYNRGVKNMDAVIKGKGAFLLPKQQKDTIAMPKNTQALYASIPNKPQKKYTSKKVEALFGGPDQPEVQSFTPAGNDNLVDLFTGDFSYNIPLMDIDGYPINLAYNAGVGMEQEASWVGLGWTLNPGVINRNMRGIPDDFNGSDQVVQELNQADNWTVGTSIGANLEVFGIDLTSVPGNEDNGGISISAQLGINYNNYNGFGAEFSTGSAFGIAKKVGFDVGLQFTGSSQGGASVSQNIGLSVDSKVKNTEFGNKISIGSSFNSRQGLQNLSVGYSNSVKVASHLKARINKKQDASTGLNAGSSFSFGTSTFVPQIPFSTKASSFTARFKLGGDIVGNDASLEFSGYFSKSKLAENSRSLNAYGYMYLQNGQKNASAMLDFNRENNGAFTKNTPALPIPFLTYDTYSVSGNGLSGSYRMDRTDMGYVFDPEITSTSQSYTLGGEVDLGATFKAGIDIGGVETKGRSGVWTKNNQGTSTLGFTKTSPKFREANDLAYSADESDFSNAGAYNPVSFELNSYNSLKSELFLAPNFSNTKSTSYRRNQPMEPLLVWQVKNGFGNINLPTSSYANTHSQIDRQIGAFTVTKTDGMRYYYGLPAYSISQKNVSFAVGASESGSGLTPDYNTRLVGYSSSDASVSNSRGLDNNYNAQTIPAYAHSYLLSSVLSPNYVDVDLNGPSINDLGSYILFNYKQISSYKWRNPVNANQAMFDKGLNANPNDDRANYIYGEKELWYVQSIVSKNHVALFYTSDREDAISVNGESGGLNGAGEHMQKLDSIKLYSLPDYTQNGTNAVAIKTVHFEYDYRLCRNYPNNINAGSSDTLNGGKLCLSKLYFTYEKSYKGERTPYKFDYGFNPDYNPNNVDRWGMYKPNPTGLTGDELNDPLTNAEFPYVGYDKTNTDKWASAWNLCVIHLPTGGRTQVFYEADDYAYVQHKQATEMFKIIGVEGYNMGTSACVISESGSENKKLYFEMIPGTNILDYGQVNDVIYFRSLLSMDKDLTHYDYVPGYAEIESIGLENGLGYIKLKPQSLKDNGSKDYNPMAVAGIQFARNYLARYIPPSSQSGTQQSGDSFLNIVHALLGAFASFGELFTGPNKPLWEKGIGTTLITGKSWIKLKNPNFKKLGGGHRVKEIRTYDAWDAMIPNGTESYYGQQYQYEFDGKSSGVAAYEPQIGGEENVWRTYVANDIKLTLAPDIRNYMEKPFGETFFPSPQVGYSKIRVNSIQHQGAPGTGFSIHEFYTAKDFPTIVKNTPVMTIPRKKSKNLLLYNSSEDMIAASQGFYVESNDMHGKPKKIEIYAEAQTTPYSSVNYYYQSTPEVIESIAANRLENDVTVVLPNGNIKDVIVGRSYELVGDFRENTSEMYSANMGINLNYTIPFIFLPMILGAHFAQSKTEYRSASVSKTIERKGIIYKTVAKEYNSVVETENLAYDSETGEVILTSVNNGYEDTVYNFTYPAHWVYEGMGQSASNLGYESSALASFSNGYTSAYSTSNFNEGDEVMIQMNGNYYREWVIDKNTQAIRLANENGTTVNGTISYLKIVRSGKRNLQSVPVGRIVLMKNPLNTLTGNVFDKVLQASSIEYGQNWKRYCECNTNGINLFTTGQMGNWNPKTTYSYLSNRTQTFENLNTNTRKDGVMESYLPFFRLNGGSWSLNKDNWTFTSTVTNFSPFGAPIETVDALGRFSAVQMGYSQTKQVALSANSMHRQIGFDGFEDYDFVSCPDGHFHIAAINEVDANHAHSGKHSLHVVAASSVVFTRQIEPICDSSDCTISYQESVSDSSYNLVFQDFIPGLSVQYEVVYGDVSLDIIPQGQITTYSFSAPNSFKIKINISNEEGCNNVLIKEIQVP